MTVEIAVDDRVTANVRYVENLITAHLELQATGPSIHVYDGHVSVEVSGSQYEARAWRAAVEGRILPSHVDIHGVRRQVVLSKRVTVNVVEPPEYPARYSVRPLAIHTGKWAIFDGFDKLDIAYGEGFDRGLLMALVQEMNFQAAREARQA